VPISGNLLFLKSEELLASHEQVMRQVFGFLGVNVDFRVPPAGRLLERMRSSIHSLRARWAWSIAASGGASRRSRGSTSRTGTTAAREGRTFMGCPRWR
jgi:hypothetical protein